MKKIDIIIDNAGKPIISGSNILKGELNFIELNFTVHQNYTTFKKYMDFEWYDSMTRTIESIRSPLIASPTVNEFVYILPQFYTEKVKMQMVFVTPDSETETYSNEFDMFFKDIIDAQSGVIVAKKDILNDLDERVTAIENTQSNIDFLLSRYDETTETLKLNKLELYDATEIGYGSINLDAAIFNLINKIGAGIALNTSLVDELRTFDFPNSSGTIALLTDIEKRSQKFTPTGGNKYFTVTDFTLGNYQLIHNDSLQGSNSSSAGQIIYYAAAVDGEEITILNLS